jgi:ABC-type phosphate transport system auxiliary subunit
LKVDPRNQEMVELAGQLRLEAENTARMAGAFPRVEFQSYLDDMHESDIGLYDQLIREQDMEMETHHLAMEALSATSVEHRKQVAEALRNRLNEIFDLKQENREREIEQLSKKLEDLKSRLKQRSDLRQQIIDVRMRELLGDLRW